MATAVRVACALHKLEGSNRSSDRRDGYQPGTFSPEHRCHRFSLSLSLVFAVCHVLLFFLIHSRQCPGQRRRRSAAPGRTDSQGRSVGRCRSLPHHLRRPSKLARVHRAGRDAMAAVEGPEVSIVTGVIPCRVQQQMHVSAWHPLAAQLGADCRIFRRSSTMVGRHLVSLHRLDPAGGDLPPVLPPSTHQTPAALLLWLP